MGRADVLVVRIELWPFGDSRRLPAIEALTIVNVGRLEGDRCRYEARCDDKVALVVHDRADGPVVLLARALVALGFASGAPAPTSLRRLEPAGRAVEGGDARDVPPRQPSRRPLGQAAKVMRQGERDGRARGARPVRSPEVDP
jgi:hypothetical protein